MKVYGDLEITGDRQALEAFVVDLGQSLTGGWTRNYEREAELTKAALGRMYCFACGANGPRLASDLWMATRDNGQLYVSNILAHGFPSLTYEQYNFILSDFYECCVRPAVSISGVHSQLGDFNPRLDDFLSDSTARLLRDFSALANRSTVHPLDRQRWNKFLAAAYRENARLDPGMLQRWLIEEEKWPDDEATSLAIEYEHGRDLLQVYESQLA